MRRGGFVVTADVDDGQTVAAVRALEEAGSIDLDERAAQWQTEGWRSPPTGVASEDGLFGSRDTDYGNSRVRAYTMIPPVI